MKKSPRRVAASSRRGSSAKTWVRVALLALAGVGALLLLYLVAARWALSGPRLRAWINTTPESTLIDYDEAVSVWPGRLRLKNFRIRGSDQNVQWIIRLSEAQVNYSVAGLFAKRFRVVRVRGSGLSFRLRNKLEPAEVRKTPLSLLPPIPGFSDPPLRTRSPEQSEEPSRPWAVEVRNLTIERFEEIWLDVYRYRGNARLNGGFFLRPGILARIGPAAIDVSGGAVRIGEDPVAAALSGRIAASIDPYDIRKVEGNAVWAYISGDVKIAGRTESVRFLNHYLRSSPEPRFSGGAGTFRVAVAIEKGIAKGDVQLAANDVTAKQGRTQLKGDADVRIRIARWAVERGPLDIAGSRVTLSEVSSSGGGDRRWWGRFDLPSGKVDRGLTARIEARCRDARPIFVVLGSNLPKWTGGLLALEDFTASTTVALGPSGTRVRRLDAKGGSFQIEGDYAKVGKDRRGVFLIDSGPLNVGVGIRGDQTSIHLIGVRTWFEKEREALFPAPGTAPPRSGDPDTVGSREGTSR